MSQEFHEIRHYDGRKHRFRSHKTSIKGLSDAEISERKKQARLRRADEIKHNEKLLEYIEWITEIQQRLHLTNIQFGKRLGVSSQTVRLWKRKTGHFPSERTYRKLLALEKQAQIPITNIKIKFGVKF